MKPRADGKDASRQRSEALERVKRELADLDFPMRLEHLLEKTRDVTWLETNDGTRYTVADALQGIPVDEFSSPRHVAEALDIRWEDFADAIRPGGTGTHRPYGPDEPGNDPGDRAERAAPEYDDFARAEASPEPSEEERRRSGP